MKKEYIIVGSNNFWYASCIETKKEALAEAKKIMKHKGEQNRNYGNDEMYGDTAPYKPDTLYIYEAIEVERLYNKDEEE